MIQMKLSALDRHRLFQGPTFWDGSSRFPVYIPFQQLELCSCS